jgi:hypothetical protein
MRFGVEDLRVGESVDVELFAKKNQRNFSFSHYQKIGTFFITVYQIKTNRNILMSIVRLKTKIVYIIYLFKISVLI